MTGERPGAARLVDLPAGHGDDPPGKEGLAALLAAVLRDPRCGGAPEQVALRGWRTRHHLGEQRSSFAFWSHQATDLVSIRDDVLRTRLPAGAAGESLLDGLRARQVAAAQNRGAVPFALIGAALEHAALGVSSRGMWGTPETIAAVTAGDLTEAIDRLAARAVVHDACEAEEPHGTTGSGGTGPVVDAVRASPWRGGLDVTEWSASDAVVGVRLAVADASPEMIDMMVEVLGNGPDGRLHHEVRHRNQLAYGFTSAGWHQPSSTSIGVTATVRPEHAADAVRVLVSTVRRLANGAGAAETGLARWRCRARLLSELDGPFGLVDEAHRRAVGVRTHTERLAAIAEFDALPGLRFAPLPVAVAAVGPFEEHHHKAIAHAHEEARLP